MTEELVVEKKVSTKKRTRKWPSPLKLDIGCGLNTKKPLEEWVHLDMDEGPHIELVTDFANIPMDDDSVDEIWIGDVIEHIPLWRRDEVFTEWKRVLKKDGILAGTTPNLEHNIKQYNSREIDLNWLLQNLYGDRSGPGHQHYIIFTPATLSELLLKNGFYGVDLSGSPGAKDDPWWLVFKAKLS